MRYSPSQGYSGNRMTLSVTRHFKQYLIGAFACCDNLNGAVFEDSPLVETTDYLAVGVVFGWVLGTSSNMVEY